MRTFSQAGGIVNVLADEMAEAEKARALAIAKLRTKGVFQHLTAAVAATVAAATAFVDRHHYLTPTATSRPLPVCTFSRGLRGKRHLGAENRSGGSTIWLEGRDGNRNCSQD